MLKLLTGIAAAGAMALFASAGYACDWHKTAHVTASTEAPQESVSMSTYDGTPPVLEEQTTAEATTECPEGQADCAPKSE